MKKLLYRLSPCVAFVMALILLSFMVVAPALADDEDDFFEDEWGNDKIVLDASANNAKIADPFESVNRVFFTFNDKLYFWVLKPVAIGYKAVVADDIRMCFGNAFNNLMAPVRITNSILQGEIAGAGNELASFLINSTLGIVGLADPAHKEFGLAVSDEDFGQTLGAYGIGNGFYICWPILGPSLLRDSVGRVGDSFLDPLTYLTMADQQTGYSLHGGKLVNKVSLRLGDYEEFKNASFDPYVAVRNAYTQHRQSRVINEVSVGAVDYDASLDKIENIQLVESKDEVHVLPPSEKKEVVEAIPEVSWDTVGHGFYVLVGVFREPVNIDKQKSRLALIGKKAFVTRYNRGNYSFYGIEVSGGDDFASAKQIENELMEAGFSETTVIRH